MFFKVLLYVLMVLILIGLLGKLNYNASLYEKDDNAVEFIFPIWNWGDPWVYASFDTNGANFTKPDDLKYRYIQEEYKKFSEKKDAICAENGLQSDACELADVELEDLKTTLEDAQMELNDIIEEKGDEVRLSRSYEKKKLEF